MATGPKFGSRGVWICDAVYANSQVQFIYRLRADIFLFSCLYRACFLTWCLTYLWINVHQADIRSNAAVFQKSELQNGGADNVLHSFENFLDACMWPPCYWPLGSVGAPFVIDPLPALQPTSLSEFFIGKTFATYLKGGGDVRGPIYFWLEWKTNASWLVPNSGFIGQTPRNTCLTPIGQPVRVDKSYIF